MNAKASQERLLPTEQRRLVVLGLLRATATTAVLVALYYLLPLDRVENVTLALTVGLLILIAVAAVQLRLVIRARDPSVRAIEALASTLPLFLLLFASAYLTMANHDPATFTQPLTRTDSLYFTVTIFATVGFGDIAAVSESGRLIVTAQMLLDLLALGLVVRVFLTAARFAKRAEEATGP